MRELSMHSASKRHEVISKHLFMTYKIAPWMEKQCKQMNTPVTEVIGI
jgi:hypothetical protein